MDGGMVSNANQGFRGVLTDLPGMDGNGDAWLCAAFTHGSVAFPSFLISLFYS
jgi:hypothetical protein